MLHSFDYSVNAAFLTVSCCSGPWILSFYGSRGAVIHNGNIIENKAGDTGGLIYFGGIQTIENCIFIKNIGNLLMRDGKTGNLSLIKCCFDQPFAVEPGARSMECTVQMIGLTAFQMTHFSTAACV
jgi:hypothetical protein